MIDRREKNAEIFRDTENMYRTNDKLKAVVADSISNQKLTLADEVVEFNANKNRSGEVEVSAKRSLEAAESYAKQGKKVCVLNFASATNPGGGVENGSSAQEEAICRCSTLYPCLRTREMWGMFYIPHRQADNPLYNDDCLYTPNVKVFKSDIDFPQLMQESDWWDVNVITCAAPNLRRKPSNMMNPNGGSKAAEISNEELRELLRSRIKRIFEIAISNDAEVLILGAFGCGAFKNPPKVVAQVFAEYTVEYREYFDVIEYAVFHTEREKENYDAFRYELSDMNLDKIRRINWVKMMDKQ